jgi:flagellar basal-body rod protein FlgB
LRALAGLCMQLFNIVSRHNTWLAVRQTAIGSNIANANTPGFRAQDVQPFEMAVEQARLAVAATQPGHLAAGPQEAPTIELRREEPWEVTHSGNNVSLEQELLKAGEVNRAFRLNTSVAKAFHRMIMTSAKV